MLIEGPFAISIVDNESTQSKELHLKFTDDFIDSQVSERVVKLEAYIGSLSSAICDQETDSPDRQGMLIIKQLSEQFLHHISSDAMELDEIIVVEINKEISINYLVESSAIN